MRKAALLFGVSALCAAPLFAAPSAANAQAVVIDGPGIMVIDDGDMPRFREYVVREHPRSFYYDGVVEVGTVLPQGSIAYYDLPEQFDDTPGYAYTVVNDETVVVEPRTRRIIQVID